MNRSIRLRASRLHVRAVREQVLDHRRLSRQTRQVERRIAVCVDEARIRASAQQVFDHLLVSSTRGEHQQVFAVARLVDSSRDERGVEIIDRSSLDGVKQNHARFPASRLRMAFARLFLACFVTRLAIA